MKLLSSISLIATVSTIGFAWQSRAADPVFSGPQVGEKTTPFKVIDVTAGADGKERDPIAENGGKSTAFVFLHAIERSLAPLLRAIDQYGAERKDRLNTEVIFLQGDRLAGEQRLKAVVNSLQLKSRAGLSVDGAEGPGNYGLNKECMMTIVATRENKVTANFALTQPGIADAPKVIAALAAACGDTNPPSVESLTARGGMTGPRAERQMQRDKSDETKPKDAFPGTVPTDPQLNALMRQFIRPTNDVATVDRLMSEIRAHIKDDPGLKKQAADGWTRILHFGDHYGTSYSRKVGQEFLDQLKTAEK